jgi:tetratricopeptide (TPR) repeat protein
MKLIYIAFIFWLALMTSAQCQQTAEDCYNKGVALSDQGKYNEAIKAYNEAIRLNPNLAVAWYNKATILGRDLGKYDEAIKAYDEAIRLDPNYFAVAAWYNKGITLGIQGKYDEAIKCYEEAIRLDPNLEAAWINKGNALDAQGKYDEAIKAHDEAIRLDPNDAAAWIGKGNALLNQGTYNDIKVSSAFPSNFWQEIYAQGKYDEAIKCYDEAIRLDPNLSAAAWFNKGSALGKQGKYEDAIKAYDEAIRLDPNYALAWNGKGYVFKLLGKTSESNIAFAKAEELGYSG